MRGNELGLILKWRAMREKIKHCGFEASGVCVRLVSCELVSKDEGR